MFALPKEESPNFAVLCEWKARESNLRESGRAFFMKIFGMTTYRNKKPHKKQDTLALYEVETWNKINKHTLTSYKKGSVQNSAYVDLEAFLVFLAQLDRAPAF